MIGNTIYKLPPVAVVVVAVMVVIVPVAIRMPATAFNIPPPVRMFPAILPSFAQFDSSPFGFPAFIPMPLDSFVQTVVGAHNTFLTLVVGLHSSCTRK